MRDARATIPAFSGPEGLPMGLHQVVGAVGTDEHLIGLCAWIAGAMDPLPGT